MQIIPLLQMIQRPVHLLPPLGCVSPQRPYPNISGHYTEARHCGHYISHANGIDPRRSDNRTHATENITYKIVHSYTGGTSLADEFCKHCCGGALYGAGSVKTQITFWINGDCRLTNTSMDEIPKRNEPMDGTNQNIP